MTLKNKNRNMEAAATASLPASAEKHVKVARSFWTMARA
jgi:hypothetical protein